MKKGFTLVEMLVVIGIIAVLAAASIGSYSKITAKADKAKCQELVHNTATALTALFQKEGVWPKSLIRQQNGEIGLDGDAAYKLASYMSLTTKDGKLSGHDRFGVVTPWAANVIKNLGSKATESDVVPGGGTIADHRLRYALDLDGDGVIESVNVGGQSVDIRATAAVWCCGRDGKIETFTRGQKKDDVYSWTEGQTRNVNH